MIPVPNALALLLFFERPGFVASLRLCPPAAREEAYTFSNAIFSGSEIFWSAELIAFSAASATCPGLTVNPNFGDAEFAAFSEALADCRLQTVIVSQSQNLLLSQSFLLWFVQ